MDFSHVFQGGPSSPYGPHYDQNPAQRALAKALLTAVAKSGLNLAEVGPVVADLPNLMNRAAIVVDQTWGARQS